MTSKLVKGSVELKPTGINDCKFVSVLGRTVGVIEGNRVYMVGDHVEVSDDGCGYITPGISRPGYGRIARIYHDKTDHFYEIQMENGERGTVKSARIRVVNDIFV